MTNIGESVMETSTLSEIGTEKESGAIVADSPSSSIAPTPPKRQRGEVRDFKRRQFPRAEWFWTMMDSKLCECGCGTVVKNRFGLGHWNWVPGAKERQSIAQKIAQNNPKVRAKKSLARKGKPHPWMMGDRNPARQPGVGAKISAAKKGRPAPWLANGNNPMNRPEVKEKISAWHKAQGAAHPMSRPDVRAKLSVAQKERFSHEEEREKMRIASSLRQHPAYPSNLESIVRKALDSMSIPYEHSQTLSPLLDGLTYNGIGGVKHLNRHQFDIVFKSLKIALEVDGCYTHACPVHCPNAKGYYPDVARARDPVLYGFMKSHPDDWDLRILHEHDVWEPNTHKVSIDLAKKVLLEVVPELNAFERIS